MAKREDARIACPTEWAEAWLRLHAMPNAPGYLAMSVATFEALTADYTPEQMAAAAVEWKADEPDRS